METENTKRYICCFLATIILFLGMCLDLVKADSFFLYDSKISTDAVISSGDEIADEEVSCTSEMLGSGKTMQIRNQYPQGSGREQYRNILLSFIVGVFLQYLFLLHEAARHDFCRVMYSDAVTIAYIHRTDGEK